jgi:hypothetical protein
VAENRNGQDRVDLDLIVLDEVHTNDCDMFLNGSLECTCNNRFRAECADQEHIKLGIQVSLLDRFFKGGKKVPSFIKHRLLLPDFAVLRTWHMVKHQLFSYCQIGQHKIKDQFSKTKLLQIYISSYNFIYIRHIVSSA